MKKYRNAVHVDVITMTMIGTLIMIIGKHMRQSMNGKGDKPRPTDLKRYGDGWDRVYLNNQNERNEMSDLEYEQWMQITDDILKKLPLDDEMLHIDGVVDFRDELIILFKHRIDTGILAKPDKNE